MEAVSNIVTVNVRIDLEKEKIIDIEFDGLFYETRENVNLIDFVKDCRVVDKFYSNIGKITNKRNSISVKVQQKNHPNNHNKFEKSDVLKKINGCAVLKSDIEKMCKLLPDKFTSEDLRAIIKENYPENVDTTIKLKGCHYLRFLQDENIVNLIGINGKGVHAANVYCFLDRNPILNSLTEA